MVLKIFHETSVYAYKDIDDTFCVISSYGGMMSIQFDVQIDHPLYPYMREETRLEYDGQYYLIKGVNERSSAGVCTINAELDLTGLESKIYISKTWSTVSFANFTADILRDTGWRIQNAEMISKRTTTEAKDNTPLDLLSQSNNSTSYGTCFSFDTKNRTITCIKPENNTTSTGCYFTDELNLSEVSFKGSSSGLVTKLYPIGKDGLTIASVNSGVEFIENYSYTEKVVCQVWRDERYTNAQSLKDDAVVKLAAMANPERSYTCKVTDLAKTNPDTYGTLLSYKLYDVITLLDRIRMVPVDHRIVETREYPTNHTLDMVTLSSIAGKITGQLTAINDRVTELDAQQLHDREKINEIKQDIDSTVLHVSESWASSENSSTITQTADGLYLDVTKIVGTGQWSTKLRQSPTDIQIAWNDISDYIKLESGALNIYNASNEKIISYGKTGHFHYANNKTIGRIGTYNFTADASLPGLQFYINKNEAAFMGWGSGYLDNSAISQDNDYKWLYAVKKFNAFDADTLNAGCDIDVHGYNLKNAVLKDWEISGGSISDTVSGYYVTQFNSDGTAKAWRSFSLTFNNGILKSAKW